MLLLVVAAILSSSSGLPVKSPSAVGMSERRLDAINRVIARGIKAGGFPGASVVIGRKGALVWEHGFGRLSWETSSDHVSADSTIYDLASLSKVVGTTTAIMILYDEGRVSLDAPVVSYLPGFTGGYKDSVTVRQLLEHRSGLPAGRDLWRLTHDPDQAKQYILETQLECRPGDCYIYSDLGADLLGMIVESVTGETLDVFLQERVFGPLGMTDTYYRPDAALKWRIAPTELNPPRGYPLQGEVHDENAFAMGGVAGHAGMFSTASDLAVFAQMLLNGGVYNGTRIVSDSVVALFTRRAAGTRALGWDTCDGEAGCGRFMGSHAYGHTGFTGTCARTWLTPRLWRARTSLARSCPCRSRSAPIVSPGGTAGFATRAGLVRRTGLIARRGRSTPSRFRA
jgi:CubicO group peptidase (beta-lactamase class C family)